MKQHDPIVDGLHRIREAMGRAHGFDIQRIAAAVRERELRHRKPVIKALPKRSARARKAS